MAAHPRMCARFGAFLSWVVGQCARYALAEDRAVALDDLWRERPVGAGLDPRRGAARPSAAAVGRVAVASGAWVSRGAADTLVVILSNTDGEPPSVLALI
jgi:hypothetical protein